MGAQLSQFFPPRPTFTEKNIPSQKGKVFLITGGTSGIGFELAKILYRKGAKVYITGRTEAKAQNAIQAIQRAVPQSEGGQLDFITLELDDLASIKTSAEAFKAKEPKLDILWNNAGVSQPPLGSVSKQGIELQLATNCLGPFLFTQMLLPLLDAAVTANTNANVDASAGSVRVVWLSSQVVELSAPPEGIIMAELSSPPRDNVRNYTTSKLGNWFLSAEFARRYGAEHAIVSVALNPGAANTSLLRNARLMKILSWPLLNSPKLAARTELFAGLSPDISMENNGCYVIPWGRIHTAVAPNLLNAMKLKEEGGTDRAKEFWDFCEERTNGYR
ncbi:hypothetical protein P175DRAFT_0496448 [Aspergillus ochraceoroseus IBT 24754]|uniref:Ketoreductase (KR) domain-containing protein n=2 Tax=Aspergillus ochraceoroseus TaxID=138278 RepID=A0A2T5LLX6_9EURO|nr:uncharacterized protein P175DRAFT_0496448 [Aspergillus ochraceoroseus IBT 24754]KKK25335.1 hypothetical protein AOCH_000932 [Aspergillus ochraceoroseus]PTU17285.1 hypothetical protein P175DRAFT_0496448 [Aspergillus ochraceoroseus IBT 24754]